VCARVSDDDATAETADPADMVGRHFRLPDYYEVGREKIRDSGTPRSRQPWS